MFHDLRIDFTWFIVRCYGLTLLTGLKTGDYILNPSNVYKTNNNALTCFFEQLKPDTPLLLIKFQAYEC